MRLKQSVLTLALTLFGLPIWAEEPTKATEAAKITFEDHIKPIFRQHCVSCHHQGEQKGGLAVDTYGAVIEGGGSGEIVYEGDADGSRLWQLVSHEDTPEMPPNKDKLPEDQLTLIRTWIEQGMPENSGSTVKEKKKNALAMVSASNGKPDGPVAMPVSLPQAVPVLTSRAAAITSIAASPWAPLVAIAGEHQISIYHTETSELLGIIPFADGIAQSLRFSRDGAYLVAGGGEHSAQGVVAIFDIKTGQRIATVGDELDTVFGADVNDRMSRIALGGPKKMLRVYDATDGSLVFDLKKHTDWIYCVAYSPDGVLLASGDRSAGLCVWEAETGQLYLDLTEHKGAINAIAWRDDSNVIASASDDGSVKMWDMITGKSIKTITAHGGGVMDVCFDHTGRLVTCGKDQRVKLWDPAGNLIKELEPMGETSLTCAISHDGSRVIAGDWNGQVLMTLIDDPTKKTPLAANPEPVNIRIEKTKQTLASIQTEMAPAQSALETATAAVAASQKQVNDVKAKIAALQAEAAKATEASTTAMAAISEIDAQVPALVAQGRDAHDAIIASRISKAPIEQVAASEETLGKQLLELAAKRRHRVELEKQVAMLQQTAKAKTDEMAAVAATLPSLEQALTAANQAFAIAKQQHDVLSTRQNELNTRMAQLAAALQ
jgi:WD40 repeat protein